MSLININKIAKSNNIEFMLTFRNLWEKEVKKYLLRNNVDIDSDKSIAKVLFNEKKEWGAPPIKIGNYELLHKLVIHPLNFSHSDLKEFKKRAQVFKNKRFKKYLLLVLLETSKDNKRTNWKKITKMNNNLSELC